ncbi:putative ADP-ribosylation factor GTPase-activating protein 1 [Elsinoe fawcettii]|nr:putative ADP-ribosylation factor GTPase-activating protein 1 [Elsinoe fawcettii]
MSRRPNPAADKAAQNQATLKQLVKLEGNKSCADCKRNKHPRWASWNLGIFVCIRCSGIHRGMGTHISRVKSVDLDAWTDEQLQSMIRWGNTRANKYWEAKLAPGHVPAEAKIENFIRTKYDSRRWAMDGAMPDPSTLDAGDDDAPLNVVQEKAKLDRASSLRNGSSTASPAARRANAIDLFADEPSQPARPNTTEPVPASRPPPVRAPAQPAGPPKQQKQGESLLGLDFFGGSQSAPPARPASATSGAGGGMPQRTDLKQSILSLYASAPKPAPAPQASTQSFGGMTPSQPPPQTSSGLDDAFSSLNFGSSQPAAPKASPFSGFSTSAAKPTTTTTPALSGGSFFDTKPAAQTPKPPTARAPSGFGDFGDFTSATPSAAPVPKAAPAVSSNMGDLFDLGGPAPAPKPAAAAPTPRQPSVSKPPPINMSSYTSNSAFNLSQPTQASQPKPAAPAANNFAAMSDPWGSDNAWNTPDPEPPKAAPSKQTPPMSTPKAPATVSLSDDFGGWGSNDTAPAKATVTQDDDFGGWSSASPVATHTSQPAPAATSSSNAPPKPFTSDAGLFDNVWE